MDQINQQIQRIKAKLAQIQENIEENGWEQYEQNFRVSAHGFQMNQPISLADLTSFEEQYSIQLPEDYRQFLLQVGNGGAGPYYGLLPLERWYDYSDPFGNSSLEEVINLIHLDPVAHFSGDCTAEPDPVTGYGVDPGNEFPEFWSGGTIALCNQGCNYKSSLVVNGKYRGRVVYSGMMGEPYYMPDACFLDWYERWLDETLSGKRIGWFGGYGWFDEAEDNSAKEIESVDLF
jgi:hypothetical protein